MKLGLGLGLGGSGNALPRSVTDFVTDFANGFELPGNTYTGGPTVVADNTGTLVTSPASVLPIEGMRLTDGVWLPTDASGDPIHTSTPLRTSKGTVSVYDESYRGPLIEPARTNLFLKSTVPVTQNITTAAQQYTVTVKGTGSVTLSGTAAGVATDGSPLTVTATAGTLTCTVAGTLSRVNVEAGAFGTSFITTGATTVTRPAANLTRPTAGTALESGNNFAIYGRVVPKAGGQSKTLFSSYLDTTHYFEVYTLSGATVSIRKAIGGSNIYNDKSYTQVAGIPFEYLAYNHSVYGMGVTVKQDGGSWLVFSENTYGQSVTLPASYQVGAGRNANHFAANYPFTEIIRLNPNLHPQTQLADLLANGRI